MLTARRFAESKMPMVEAPRLPSIITDAWLSKQGVAEPARLRASMRPEKVVASLETVRSLKSTRLSFARLLIRRMVEHHWKILPYRIKVDARGVGHLIYRIEAEGQVFCFVVFSRENVGAERTGAVSEGNNFDFFGSLYEGDVDEALIQADDAAMAAGYWRARTADMKTLGWTLANRSLRGFDHVVEALAAGRQPDEDFVNRSGGYIIRNAGYYANGRHGTKASVGLAEDNPLKHHYFPDLLALYMWRVAAFDVAEATAKAITANAVPIAADIKNRLGVGNTSGLGMVANVVRWPAWTGAILTVRELSLAYALTRRGAIESQRIDRFRQVVKRAESYYAGQAPVLFDRYADVAEVSIGLGAFFAEAEQILDAAVRGDNSRFFWSELSECASGYHPEVREQVHAMIIEAEKDFADASAGLLPRLMMTERAVDPFQSIGQLRAELQDRLGWALDIALAAKRHDHFYWFRSSFNGENLRAVKQADPNAVKATFVDLPEASAELYHALQSAQDQTVGRFLLQHPQFYHIVSRLQLSQKIPYTEIRGNIVDEHGVPGDIIRFFLAALGLEASQAPLREEYAVHLIRGVFFQGAPLPAQIIAGTADPDAIFPFADAEHANVS